MFNFIYICIVAFTGMLCANWWQNVDIIVLSRLLLIVNIQHTQHLHNRVPLLLYHGGPNAHPSYSSSARQQLILVPTPPALL